MALSVGSSAGTGLDSLGLINSEAQSNRAALEGDIKKAESFESILKNASESGDTEQLKKACSDFEQYFLQLMYKQMRSTVSIGSGSLVTKSQAEQYFQEMLDEEYSKRATNVGGIGLAKFLYEQLSGQYQLPVKPPFANETASQGVDVTEVSE